VPDANRSSSRQAARALGVIVDDDAEILEAAALQPDMKPSAVMASLQFSGPVS
jgi:hypothetical protein